MQVLKAREVYVQKVLRDVGLAMYYAIVPISIIEKIQDHNIIVKFEFNVQKCQKDFNDYKIHRHKDKDLVFFYKYMYNIKFVLSYEDNRT